MADKLTATDIKRALSEKHSEDFFACEVKNGSTWFADEYLKFDALAIKKSWSKPCVTIYEIKVSKSDFKSDKKWGTYLKYCNEFYWVCPKDLISKDDIDKGCGLIYSYPSGALKTIQKPLYRIVDYVPDLFLYIIMNKIESDRYPFHNDKASFFKDYLAQKESAKLYSYKLPEFFKSWEDRLKEREKLLDNFERNNLLIKLMEEKGLHLGRYDNNENDVMDCLNRFIEKNIPTSKKLPEHIRRDIYRTRDILDNVIKSIESKE